LPGKVPLGSDATIDRPGVNAIWMEDMDSQRLCKRDVTRIIENIHIAKQHSDLCIIYQHNHYWEKI